jgi:hypothetical protein
MRRRTFPTVCSRRLGRCGESLDALYADGFAYVVNLHLPQSIAVG